MSEAGSTPTVAISKDLRGALPAGARLRGYEILAVLGHGGFGVTYRARDTTLGRDVAIKEYLPTAVAVREDGTTVLPRSTELAEEFSWGRDRFLEEARTLARLDGAPAIVRVFDFLEANGTAYMVMALLDGEPLEQRLKREGCLPQPAIERLLYPLLDGLEAVHATGFLHRDIKPDNIMLDAKSNPTLIDFGASRAPMAGRTAAMTAIFTPGYGAAEQFTSAKQGPWTDIYGLSATLYHAITGRPPPSAFDRMVKDTHEPLVRRQPAGFSPAFLVAIDAGLRMAATDRPQSIAEWRAMLGVPATPDRLAPVASPAPKRGFGLWIGLAAAAILVLAGGGYYFFSSQASAPAIGAAPVAEKAAPEMAADKVAPEKAARTVPAGQSQQVQEELARLRAEAAALEKAEQEATLRRQIEEETRRKIEAEMAEKKRVEDEARKKSAETAEAALGMTTIDRQHVQAALVALGYGVTFMNGTFDQWTRDAITRWQQARSYPRTGFLTALQYLALMKEAATAVSKFDDEQKKFEEEKKKAAMAPPSSSPPDFLPLEEDKKIFLNSDGGKCNAVGSYIARVYPKKLGIMFRGGWQTFEANAGGDFGRSFTIPVIETKLSVKGNLKTRFVSIENTVSGCLWKGSF